MFGVDSGRVQNETLSGQDAFSVLPVAAEAVELPDNQDVFFAHWFEACIETGPGVTLRAERLTELETNTG